MKKLFLSIFLLSLTSSCALIFNGKHQSVFFMGSDTSAKVDAQLVSAGETTNITLPARATVRRSSGILTVNVKESDCYKASQTFNSSKYSFFNLLNILGSWFSTTSTTVDATTGAIWTYDDTVIVNLNKKPGCVEK